ncbi:MAG: hypothetical protein LC768_10075 [Acidobacteria bacterium]|nr:hypothetical protein [Acidobacteriota bacterium]MCA1638664.1 hypothetical protein [Acidobacteriota bacterium]
MRRIFISFIVIILWVGLNSNVLAQNTEQKTQDLISALGKTKYKKKEKKNFSFELYIDIKSEAVVKPDVRDYAGVYQSADADYQIELRVAADGKVEGNGYGSLFDNSQKRNFTLKDARIDGALLTATKVFADGRTEKLEAVFNNRTMIEGKNPNEITSRETKYGLGFIDIFGTGGANITNRVFLEFKP